MLLKSLRKTCHQQIMYDQRFIQSSKMSTDHPKTIQLDPQQPFVKTFSTLIFKNHFQKCIISINFRGYSIMKYFSFFICNKIYPFIYSLIFESVYRMVGKSYDNTIYYSAECFFNFASSVIFIIIPSIKILRINALK